jgi:hypothetical protein
MFYSFSLHFLLHNLSWYQRFRSKPLHTVRRETRSSLRRASRILRARDTVSFTRFGELFVILKKDPRRKLPRGTRPSYIQHIVIRSLREVSERTTLESFKVQKHEKEVETEKAQTVKILAHFSRIVKD